MAIPNTNLLQTKKPLSLPLLAFITIYLMLLSRVNSSDSLSFTFNDFKPDERNLIFQGAAKISSSNTLQLTKTDSQGTPQRNTVGRVLHTAQVRLWEKSTGRLASFETTFTFVLTSPKTQPADGFTFFIAPPETTIPDGSAGGTLGLFSPETAVDPSANQVVAVEFDTFYDRSSNDWDPNYVHIGIDVNSINSSKHVRWERNDGAIGTARIAYNAATQNLSVVSSYPNGKEFAVSYVVDLKTVLPEWVRVGFSGASGEEVQTHNIRSWHFSSSLQYTKAKKEDAYISRYV